MIKCNHCGQLVDDSATFCPKCGQQVTPANPQPPQFQQQPPQFQQNPPQFQQQQYQQQYQNQGYTIGPNGLKVKNIEMLEACKMFWQNYANFEGRSRRAEYWWAYLMVFVIGCVVGWIPVIGWLASLACIIPNLAVGARRLHDINKSGWFLLLNLIPLAGTILLIIWFCKEGDIGPNQYGNDPKHIF